MRVFVVCKVFLFVFAIFFMSVSRNVNISLADDKVIRKGSGIQLIFGVLLLIISVWVQLVTNIGVYLYVLLPVGIVLIISSFLIIINQYDRAVVLRLGVYKRQIRPGIHTRIPLIDNVLVIDIREKVRGNLTLREC